MICTPVPAPRAATIRIMRNAERTLDVDRTKLEGKAASPSLWKALCGDCGPRRLPCRTASGALFQGCDGAGLPSRKGLFPTPKEIKLSCSCPDWADMCKHVAAVLYGVGARLDASPELLFLLRGVGHAELVAKAGEELLLKEADRRRACNGRGRSLRTVRRGDGGNRRRRRPSTKAPAKKGQGKGKARAKTPGKAALAAPASNRSSRAKSAESPRTNSDPRLSRCGRPGAIGEVAAPDAASR